MSDQNLFNNLCSHYKDTFDVHRDTAKQRDGLFYILLLIIALFTSQMSSTELTIQWASQFVENIFGIKIGSRADVLSSILWLSLTGISVRYFQINITMERQYGYLHSLESEINKSYGDTSVAFTREGKTYLSDYPAFSNWMHTFYTKFLPVIILLVSMVKIISELHTVNINLLLDSACYFIISVSTILYMIFINKIGQSSPKKNSSALTDQENKANSL